MDQPFRHRWVAEAQGLEDLRRALVSGSALALDSESNSGFAYEERLCLLQINDGREVWLVDPLAMDRGRSALEPLRSILEDILLDTMFDLPGLDSVNEVVVNEESVNSDAAPLMIHGEPEKEPATAG